MWSWWCSVLIFSRGFRKRNDHAARLIKILSEVKKYLNLSIDSVGCFRFSVTSCAMIEACDETSCDIKIVLIRLLNLKLCHMIPITSNYLLPHTLKTYGITVRRSARAQAYYDTCYSVTCQDSLSTYALFIIEDL